MITRLTHPQNKQDEPNTPEYYPAYCLLEIWILPGKSNSIKKDNSLKTFIKRKKSRRFRYGKAQFAYFKASTVRSLPSRHVTPAHKIRWLQNQRCFTVRRPQRESLAFVFNLRLYKGQGQYISSLKRFQLSCNQAWSLKPSTYIGCSHTFLDYLSFFTYPRWGIYTEPPSCFVGNFNAHKLR